MRQVPVDSRRSDWPRLVAQRLNTAMADLDQLILIAGSAAAASINYLQLEGEADTTGFDGLFLSGDANVTGVDFLLHA